MGHVEYEICVDRICINDTRATWDGYLSRIHFVPEFNTPREAQQPGK